MRHAAFDLSLLLIAALLFSAFAFAEDIATSSDTSAEPTAAPVLTEVPADALLPFSLTLPDDASVELTDGRTVLVSGGARVVAMVIARTPDEDPENTLPELMNQFDANTDELIEFTAEDGFHILGGVVTDAFGEGDDKITVMVLAGTGDLLILSGYHLEKDHQALYTFLTDLLSRVTMDGMHVYVPDADIAAD